MHDAQQNENRIILSFAAFVGFGVLMMELSQEIQTILQKYRPQKLSRQINDDFLIDVADMDFDNETWLVDSSPVTDLAKFFKCDSNMMTSSDSDTSNEVYKQFDSRTFTRPKRKFNRPSIEKYNEDYFANDMRAAHLSDKNKAPLTEEIDSYMSISSTTLEDGMSEKHRPVHFDLTQPISTSIFENIANNSGEMDSFQNMSPPSLVNSMCSSTFTNLMENSYIKNDPILREIRDADYSSVIYQEMEPPLYQSITESCSSINTEVAETFVRKTLNSLNCTFNKRQEHISKSGTANDDDGQDQFSETQLHAENIDPNATYCTVNAFNGTYRKSKSPAQALNNTFVTVAVADNDHLLNATFQLKDSDIMGDECEKVEPQVESGDCNTTFAVRHSETHSNRMNNTFKRDKSSKFSTFNATFNRNDKEREQEKIGNTTRIVPKIDNYMIQEPPVENKMKRLSNEIDEYLSQKMSLYSDTEDNSMHYSTKSTDSLDRLSSISNSSRDSKLMAEVDAIVERQERSLQVMSTPKPTKSFIKPLDRIQLSPIPNLNLKEHLSDSEVSSGEYTTVRSRFSDHNATQSLSNLKYTEGNNMKSIHTITDNQRFAPGLRRPSTATSYSGGLRKESKISGSYGNLRKLSSNLGSSYTNLRPKSMVLPNIPARGDVFAQQEEFKIPQVPLKTRDFQSNPKDTFVKPKVTNLTNLPRPTGGTGIPRPASRIPGPRTSRLPLSRTKATSKSNLSDGSY